ncbi:hypothetical protein [Alcanivorax sp. S71-1-4]|uniref:hypothetical protein n=1 Tax=Alcanivorax sp. S71-1-4 TaxID=1177159 RepID=UPI001356B55F|nr:hypothetical protein [Alcanivorax sp. S71-1-4]
MWQRLPLSASDITASAPLSSADAGDPPNCLSDIGSRGECGGDFESGFEKSRHYQARIDV